MYIIHNMQTNMCMYIYIYTYTVVWTQSANNVCDWYHDMHKLYTYIFNNTLHTIHNIAFTYIPYRLYYTSAVLYNCVENNTYIFSFIKMDWYAVLVLLMLSVYGVFMLSYEHIFIILSLLILIITTFSLSPIMFIAFSDTHRHGHSITSPERWQSPSPVIFGYPLVI